MNYYRA